MWLLIILTMYTCFRSNVLWFSNGCQIYLYQEIKIINVYTGSKFLLIFFPSILDVSAMYLYNVIPLGK